MAQNSVFTVLRLPERFALEPEAIESAWRASIALVHPDRFADRSAAERRVAEQWAGRINEAKETLLDPVRRAEALLAMKGVDVGSQTDTKMPADFLLQQMRWREALEEADGPEALQTLLREVDAEREALTAALTQSIDAAFDAQAARAAVRRLMFVEKLRIEIKRTAAQH